MRLPKSVLLAHASCLVERHPGGEHRAPPVFVETEIWQLAILIAVGQYSFPLATQAAKGPDIVIWALDKTGERAEGGGRCFRKTGET